MISTTLLLHIYPFSHHVQNVVVDRAKTGERRMECKFITSDVSDTDEEYAIDVSSSAKDVVGCVVNGSIATTALHVIIL